MKLFVCEIGPYSVLRPKDPALSVTGIFDVYIIHPIDSELSRCPWLQSGDTETSSLLTAQCELAVGDGPGQAGSRALFLAAPRLVSGAC